jgi:ABC-2 type transport system ATP-binding protein
MIRVENVSMFYPIPKKYIEYLVKPFLKKKFKALDGINLKIKDGDSIAFLGSNGAGKTTLLKLIGGLLYPSIGQIIINEHDTMNDNLKSREKVGFVLNEERSFYWRLTGIQNLRFFAALDNIHGKQLETKIDQLIKMVGLEDSANKLFAGYSSGMKQRLAIARGLIADPDILILDEPTRTLDPISSEEIKKIISQRIHENKVRTLLIATHSLDEAESLCNKVCIMKSGKILLYENKKTVIKEFGNLNNCYKALLSN